MYENERVRMKYVRVCVEVLFIAQRGRFPPEINMETYGHRLMRIRSSFPPKAGPFGAKVVPGDPWVRPALGSRL